MSETSPIVTKDNVTLRPQDVERALRKVQKYYIPMDRIASQGDELAHGGFGIVRRATLLPKSSATGKEVSVVVKELKIDGFRVIPLRAAYRLVREMFVWAKCEHENIVQFLGYHLGKNYDPAYLISPYMKNGNLGKYLNNNHIDSGERLELIRDTLNGVEYLHTRTPVIVHGDLKAANVLVNDSRRAQLCDFGLAAVVEETHTGHTGMTTSAGFLGSVRWCSPETIGHYKKTCASDIWAWGCLVIEVMTNEMPFANIQNDNQVFISVVVEKKTPEPDPGPNLPGGLLDLLRICWKFEAEERPNVQLCHRTLDAVILQAEVSSKLKDLSVGETSIAGLEDMAQYGEAGIDSIVGPGYRVYDHQLPPELHGTLEVPPRKLAAGIFADVYQGRWLRPGMLPVAVAIKRVNYPRNIPEATFQTMIKRETVIWAVAKHMNILPFIGYQTDSLDHVMLVSPWCDNGNLSTYIKARPDLPRLERLRLLHGAAHGLLYLHTLIPPIIHGDIKPENIIIQDNLEPGICDFGMSKIVGEQWGGTNTSSGGAITPGTKGFQAAEVLQEEPVTTASDVYAFGGVILFAMSGKTPFEGKSTAMVVMAVITGRTPLRREHPLLPPTDPMWDVYEACSVLEPEGRLSMPVLVPKLKEEIRPISYSTTG